MIPGSKKGECYICGFEGYTEKHHIFGGTARRKTSDKDDLTVYLCWDCHKGTKGAHGRDGKAVQDFLHREGQEYYEDRLIKAGSTPEEARAQFIQKYIKSYL